MLSKYNYYCPHCDFQLTDKDLVHFHIVNNKRRGTILSMSVYPGIHGYICDNNMTIRNGELIHFYCLGCGKNLLSEKYPEFVEIHLKVNKGIIFRVLFSPICGEQESYIEMEGELELFKDSYLGIKANVT